MVKINKIISAISLLGLMGWLLINLSRTLLNFGLNLLTITFLISIIGYGYLTYGAFKDFIKKNTKKDESQPCKKCGKNKVKK